MEILELAGQEQLKPAIKREIWFLWKNIYGNGDGENGQRLD
jgi:hypothetical protein